MAINFCLPAYKPKITSCTISADGYEIENLISANFRKSCQGFMAESFLKPPITITLEFLCNISIHSIVLFPSVGRQRSSSFEIYTKSIPSQKRLHEFSNRKSMMSSESGSLHEATDVFVGKCFSQNPDINFFYFQNKKFLSREPFKSTPTNFLESDDKCVIQHLRHHQSKALADVSHVTIRIVRVLAATVPCIKKLEVWGQPSSSNHQNVFNLIVSIFNSSKIPEKQENVSDYKPTSISNCDNTCTDDNSSECPEEFIDPITLEIMALPVLLPSGHTVDQSTLDRYEIESAQWGLVKADPFTNVPFSKSVKPVPHVSLKARIDKFLLTAGMEFDKVARTSGRSSDVGLISKIAVTQHGMHLPARSISKKNELPIVTPVKRKNNHCEDIPSAEKCIKTKTNSDCTHTVHSPCKIRKTVKAMSHEQKLATSLEEAMNDILATRPTYRNVTVSRTQEQPSCTCIFCKKPSDGKTVFYRLPCCHFICRHCVTLTDEINKECSSCAIPFNNFDIVRVHLC